MKTILVTSIKGGTGKSLIAINIAKYLKDKGYKVGLLDADLDSSYFSEFTKINKQLEVTQEKIKTVEWNGIKVFSLSLLLGRDRPVSLYGIDSIQVLRDIRRHVDWGKIDYLVIDMPPGAGDVFKEVLELWADSIVGGVIVMIPFAEAATKRLLKLYQLYEVPVIGIVENMAYFKCEHGKEYYLFGPNIGEKIAKEFNVTYLGKIPLDIRITEGVVKGSPIIPEDIASPILKVIDYAEKAKEKTFYEKWKQWMKQYVKSTIDQILVKSLIHLNKTLNIKAIQEYYGFKGNMPFALIITDRLDRPITSLVLKVKDGKLLVVKKRVEPVFAIKVDVPTLASILLGYKIVNGVKVPFTVEDAWASGFLRVYGPGAIPMMMYVAKTLFQNKELKKYIEENFKDILEKLM